MSDNSLVSAIVIFLNAEAYIEEAIESVLAQTYPHWELLLVDDGSADGSTQIARQYAGRYPDKIRYLEFPDHQNRGRSAARNLGISHARGQTIAFLDADDVWLPEKLAHQVGLMNDHPEAGMVYGNTLYWHSWTGRPEDQSRDYHPDLGVDAGILYRPPRLLAFWLQGKAAVPCTCSLLARTEAVRRIGGFAESITGNYEDQAFYAKMCLVESILVSDQLLDKYRQHPESHTHRTEIAGQSRQERLLFLKWLADYLRQHQFEDLQLCLALNRQTWISSLPDRFPWSGGLANSIRWGAKWLLRIEDHLMPMFLRTRLWGLEEKSH